MSILWHHGVASGRINENELVAVTSTNTAKIFNLFPRKGIIAVGSDADLVVIDPNLKRTISAKTHWSALDTNIWEGWEVNGVTVMTIQNGKIAWQAHVENGQVDWKKGTFNVQKGQGKYLPRPCFGEPYLGLDRRVKQGKKNPIPRV